MSDFQKERNEKRKLAMKFALALAKQHKFPCVVGEYSGEGDSGSVNTIDVYREGFDADDFYMAYDKRDGQATRTLNSLPFPVDFPEELKYALWSKADEKNLYEAFATLFNHITPDGYEINDGGHGVVAVDTEHNGVSISHNACYVETTNTYEVFHGDEISENS